MPGGGTIPGIIGGIPIGGNPGGILGGIPIPNGGTPGIPIGGAIGGITGGAPRAGERLITGGGSDF